MNKNLFNPINSILIISCAFLVACERPVVRQLRYKNQNLLGEVTYLKDIPHGKFRYYYNSGDPKKFGEYNKGALDGQITYYYEGEKVKAVVHYEEGIKNGAEVIYHENGGRIKSIKQYDNGKLVSEKEYDANGRLLLFKNY